MIIKSKVIKLLGDNINTDYIIAGKHKFKTINMGELVKHLFEDIEKDFYEKIKKNKISIIVAGNNFGCGSSREQAPLLIKHSGIKCIIANSFARIFFRNAINLGLPLVECDTSFIKNNDDVKVDFDKGKVYNLTTNREVEFPKLPPFILKILSDGGLIAHIKKHNGYYYPPY